MSEGARTLSLREKLKALEELQQIDLEMNEVQAALAALPARRAEVEAAVGVARKAWEQEQARLDQNERERRQLESLLSMERDKVKKWEGRLGEIRTPREYAALSREIDIAKKTNDGQSEQVKELAASAAEIKKALEAREEQLSDREAAAQAAVEDLEGKKSAADEKVRALQARRAEAVKQVDPGLLAKYENIKRRRAGVAIAPVVGMTCKGCHRNVPPQLAITLQKANSIETCPNCHRIIYSAEAVNPPAPSPA
jgi:predicted  nucleic acid-binding Zn-ribbon protein